jgi:hypothetical protein
MISKNKGFFIEHPSHVDRQDRIVPFSYHSIMHVDGMWKSKKLFNFTIPAHLLFTGSESRLYESILPLLPRYIDGSMYYVDCVTGKFNRRSLNCSLYRYDCATAITSLAFDAQSRHHHLFTPLKVTGMLYSGGAVTHQNGVLPTMWLDDNGMMCADMAAF